MFPLILPARPHLRSLGSIQIAAPGVQVALRRGTELPACALDNDVLVEVRRWSSTIIICMCRPAGDLSVPAPPLLPLASNRRERQGALLRWSLSPTCCATSRD